MTDTITLTGLVATDPRHIVTSDGLAITNFRLASTQRRFDKKEQRWVDAETNWYTVTGFRQLALNVIASVKKGERVVVSGRLKIRSWDNGEKTGMNVEVEADAVGHDLAWGTSGFNRTILVSNAAEAADARAADAQTAEAQGIAEGSQGVEHSPVESFDAATGEVSELVLESDATPVPF